MRVCVRTYRLFYVSGGEESFWRIRTPVDGREALKERSVTRKEERQKWLEKWLSEDIPEETTKDGVGASGEKSVEKDSAKTTSPNQSQGSRRSAEAEKKGSKPEVVVVDDESEVPIELEKIEVETIEVDKPLKEKSPKERDDSAKKSPALDADIPKSTKELEKDGALEDGEDVSMEVAQSA